ncbi:MAG: N-acetyltransferase family protein [Clostridia bacterium]
MNIRKARAEDYLKLKSLNKSLLKETGEYFSDAIFQQEALFKLLVNSENQMIVVAECDDVVCGYAITVISHMPNFDTVRLDQIYVAPDFRSKGIAQSMIDFIIEHAKKERIFEISLRVNSQNLSAINFYKKKGFKIQEHIMNMTF